VRESPGECSSVASEELKRQLSANSKRKGVPAWTRERRTCIIPPGTGAALNVVTEWLVMPNQRALLNLSNPK
jgi:hypothetical protein